MRLTVLMIDDDKSAMKKHCDALVRHFDVHRRTTVREGISAYKDLLVDAVVLDVMMPREENDADSDREGGIFAYKEMRARSTQIPIIVYTNLAISSIKKNFRNDSRVYLLNKGETNPFQLVEAVRKAASDWPREHVDSMGDFDLNDVMGPVDPNEAPYYVIDEGHRSVRVRFEISEGADGDKLADEWDGARFRDMFIHYVQEPETQPFTLKLLRHGETDDDRIHGMLYSGGDSTQWYLNALIETAPWNDEEAEERVFRRVDKVLTVRFLFDYEQRTSSKEFCIHVGAMGEFFRRLGFKPLKQSSNLYYLTQDRADELIAEVQRKD